MSPTSPVAAPLRGLTQLARAAAAPRRKALAAVVALVLVLHAWLLVGEAPRPGAGGPANGRRPLQVRQLVAPPIAAPGPQPAATVPQPRATANRTPSPRTAPTPAIAPSPEPTTAGAAAQDTRDVPPAAAPGTEVPVYATRPPPAATLHYTMRRGALLGQAELQWRPGPEGYRISLQHDPTGPRAMTGWSSQGVLDSAGVAPERYVESRRGREQRAANFQRTAGRISFSGPTLELPLPAGVQDRLSWMIQLGAVLEADPALGAPGGELVMWVVGTRGDAEPWRFAVLDREDLELPAGTVAGALRLRRTPGRPYDTLADVWLDPARHHLPVQLRLRLLGAGEVLELQLATAQVE